MDHPLASSDTTTPTAPVLETGGVPAPQPSPSSTTTGDDSTPSQPQVSETAEHSSSQSETASTQDGINPPQPEIVSAIEPSSPRQSSHTSPSPPRQPATPPSSYSTPHTPAAQSSSVNREFLPAPWPEPTARALAIPYRAAFKPKPKGILKPPTVTPSRFSFRRDVLNPFNARLAYSVGAAAPTTSAGPPQPGGAPPAPSSPALAPGAGVGGTAAANLVQGTAAAAAAAGGFWGSALKKLSGVGVVAPLPGIAPQRDLADDQDTNHSSSATAANGLASTSSAASPISIPTPSSPTTDRRHPLHSASSLDGPAPHTPTKSAPSAGSISSSPYATIKATLSPAMGSMAGASGSNSPAVVAERTPPPLSVREMRKVRFRMAALKIVYPINGPNGPLAPWQEGETRRR